MCDLIIVIHIGWAGSELCLPYHRNHLTSESLSWGSIVETPPFMNGTFGKFEVSFIMEMLWRLLE